MRRLVCATTLLGLALSFSSSGLRATETAGVSDLPNTVAALLFGRSNVWDGSYAQWQFWKAAHSLPITLGAHNWFHANQDGPAPSGYGVPGLRGTYFWFVDLDPRLKLDTRSVDAVGAHVEFRFRESPDKFRSFIKHRYWFYEAYGYVDTPAVRIKAGQIWKRFGLDWDNSWWGDVQYFDGLKLDTAYGLSWENTWKPAARFKVDSFVQYFGQEANVSGSLGGANTQSIAGAHERNLGVIRVVPTWQLSHSSSIAVGLSGLTGDVHFPPGVAPDTTQRAWAADATYTVGGLSVFAEFDRSFGVLNPTHYISGGPSDAVTDTLAGIAYRYGPVTYRFDYSSGRAAHPTGHQHIWIPGVTIALSKSTNLYAEYVYWDGKNRLGQHSVLENGYQLVLNWHI